MSRKRKTTPLKSNASVAISPFANEDGQQSVAQSRQRAVMLADRMFNKNNYILTHVATSSSSITTPLPKQLPPFIISSTYFDCGDCDQICEHCHARFWYAERIISSPSNQRPKYNQCCKSGRVRLRFPKEPPTAIKLLFEITDFIDNVPAYNSMFAMTSFGANIDESINNSLGPYVFKVEGKICHWLGSLCPPPDEPPRFLQMYIYDTQQELSNRLHFFNDREHSALKSDIVQLLIKILDDFNELIKLFRTARDLFLSTTVPDFNIRLYNANNQICYDTPSQGTIGAIVYDNGPMARDFDIVIHMKDGHPKQINKLHPLYMALQFPLLFVFGEHGWSPELRMQPDAHKSDRYLTMNMFYSYQLHDRLDLYTLLLRGGRLFQQYLVDAYICIEQNGLDYIQSHQNLFRMEYFQGIHDALLRGDSDDHDVGKRTILPASFTGGPRYMYKHYQDALAICRVHDNPQYFITFTCNVKWPEIKRYLHPTPSVKAQDRSDIIARVFQIKVEAFIKYLKSATPFGQVAADLYTIEFQKRGLPHCHTLLWVKPSYKIQCPEQVDSFISAEIPDPTNEPILYRIVTESMMHRPCGLPKMNAPCMCNGVCSKHFPKKYEQTTQFDKDGYVHYKRSVNGRSITKSGVSLDNVYVVPYNKALCLHSEAHINVEYCGWSMMIKYLFKYISKGTDRIRFKITKSLPALDEAESDRPKHKLLLMLASFALMRRRGGYLTFLSIIEIHPYKFWPCI